MFKVTKDMRKKIGGRMIYFKKGDSLLLEEETIRQNFEEGDYEDNGLPEVQEEEEEVPEKWK